MSGTKGAEKVFLIGLIIWLLAHLIRCIAIPLIQSVAHGINAPGWIYPSVLDVITAVLALPLLIAIWKWRGFTVWMLTIAYLTLSIVDHIGALTNMSLIGAPICFAGFNEGGDPFIAPVVQTVLDVVFLTLLLMPRFRRKFFEIRDDGGA